MSNNASNVDFPQRLAHVRKRHKLIQARFAERIGAHVLHLRRYEAGTSRPTLDVIRKLVTVLQVENAASKSTRRA